ncbi:MAG: cyclic nucleotide-binding domain-containing protein [Spirochaetota bacterium]
MVKMLSSQKISTQAQTKRFQKDETIFTIGEPSDGKMYFILEGECRIFTVIKNGREESHFLKAGDFFGESALISTKPRNSKVIVTSSKLKALLLDKRNLKQQLTDSPKFAYSVFRAISARLLNLESFLSEQISQAPKMKLDLLETIHQPKIKLPSKEMLRYLETLPSLEFATDECVHTEEDDSKAIMYFLHSGKFRLEKQYNIENKLTLTFQDNHFFGETQLIGGRKIGHTVTVTEGPAKVIPIDEAAFFEIIRISPSFFTNQLQFVIWKLNTSKKAIRYLASKQISSQTSQETYNDTHTYAQGDAIYQKGDSNQNSIYFILEGSCLGKTSKKAKKSTIYQQGEFFGELGLINNAARETTVSVESVKARILELNADSLIQKAMEKPEFIFSILKAGIARLYRSEVLLYSLVQKLPEKERNLAERYEFTTLRNKSLFDYIDNLSIKTYKMGDFVYKDSQAAKGDFYLVLDGRIALCKEYNKRNAHLTYLTDGDFFGEVSLIADYPRYHSALSFDRSTVAKINRDNFLELLGEYPEFAYGLLRNTIWKFSNLEKWNRRLQEAK